MLKQMVQSLVEQVASALNVRMVYGEPISAEGKTIIPVAKVAGGFGAGAGAKKLGETEEDKPGSEGGGAGGGFSAKPVGLIEVTSEKTRFIPVRSSNGALWAAAAGGFLLGLFLFRRRR